MKYLLLSAWNRLSRRVGFAGLAGLGLLLIAAATAAWLSIVIRQGQDLRAASKLSASHSPEFTAVLRSAPVPVAKQIGEFTAAFPSISQNPDDLKVVFASAAKRHLQLSRGDYQLKQEPNAPLISFTATFPLKSDYSSVKEFSADVLRELPHVAMDELRMTRKSSNSTELDSVIRFRFIYRRS